MHRASDHLVDELQTARRLLRYVVQSLAADCLTEYIQMYIHQCPDQIVTLPRISLCGWGVLSRTVLIDEPGFPAIGVTLWWRESTAAPLSYH
jgi:hypothetical protein